MIEVSFAACSPSTEPTARVKAVTILSLRLSSSNRWLKNVATEWAQRPRGIGTHSHFHAHLARQAERLDGSIVHVAEVGHALSGQSSLGHLPGAPPPPDYLRRDCPRLALASSYGCLSTCEVMQTVR